jgi:lysophospholipase L1-like esterase
MMLKNAHLSFVLILMVSMALVTASMAAAAPGIADAPSVALQATSIDGRSITFIKATLKRLMAAAMVSNPRINAVYTPVAVTSPASADATLTKQYFAATSGGPTTIAMSHFLVHGGTATQFPSQPFLVFPVSYDGPTGGSNLSGYLPGSYLSAWTWEVEFSTDAPTIEISTLATRMQNYEVIVGDQYSTAESIVPNSYSGPQVTRLIFGSSTPRRIRFRSRGVSAFKGVSVGASYTVWKPSAGDTIIVAATGDSYFEGQGIGFTTGKRVPSNPDGSLGNAIADQMGWSDLREVAVGSTGYLVNAVTRSTVLNQIPHWGFTPNVILCGSGFNDEALLFGGSAFTGSISGNELTVTALSRGPLVIGQTLTGAGISGSPTITPGGSGTGGAGKYNLSANFTVSSEVITGAITASLIATQATATWAAMRDAYPRAIIFVFGPWSGARNQRSTMLATENAISAAFTAWGDRNSYFIPVNTDPAPWTTGTGNSNAPNGTGNSDYYMASDTTHPNDAGHIQYANRAVVGIRSVISGF